MFQVSHICQMSTFGPQSIASKTHMHSERMNNYDQSVHGVECGVRLGDFSNILKITSSLN